MSGVRADASRQRAARSRLRRAGGRTLSVNLSHQAARDLEQLSELMAGTERGRQRAAVETALRFAVMKLCTVAR